MDWLLASMMISCQVAPAPRLAFTGASLSFSSAQALMAACGKRVKGTDHTRCIFFLFVDINRIFTVLLDNSCRLFEFFGFKFEKNRNRTSYRLRVWRVDDTTNCWYRKSASPFQFYCSVIFLLFFSFSVSFLSFFCKRVRCFYHMFPPQFQEFLFENFNLISKHSIEMLKL